MCSQLTSWQSWRNFCRSLLSFKRIRSSLAPSRVFLCLWIELNGNIYKIVILKYAESELLAKLIDFPSCGYNFKGRILRIPFNISTPWMWILISKIHISQMFNMRISGIDLQFRWLSTGRQTNPPQLFHAEVFGQTWDTRKWMDSNYIVKIPNIEHCFAACDVPLKLILKHSFGFEVIIMPASDFFCCLCWCGQEQRGLWSRVIRCLSYHVILKAFFFCYYCWLIINSYHYTNLNVAKEWFFLMLRGWKCNGISSPTRKSIDATLNKMLNDIESKQSAWLVPHAPP